MSRSVTPDWHNCTDHEHVHRSVTGASQSYVSYAAFEDLFRHLCISRWSLPLSYRGWTTVMRRWPVFRPACFTLSSLSSTRQLGRSPVFVSRSILQMLTGFEHPIASYSNWRSLSTELFTTLHLISGQLQYVADLPSRR